MTRTRLTICFERDGRLGLSCGPKDRCRYGCAKSCFLNAPRRTSGSGAGAAREVQPIREVLLLICRRFNNARSPTQLFVVHRPCGRDRCAETGLTGYSRLKDIGRSEETALWASTPP